MLKLLSGSAKASGNRGQLFVLQLRQLAHADFATGEPLTPKAFAEDFKGK